jgi:hypothetical protein
MRASAFLTAFLVLTATLPGRAQVGANDWILGVWHVQNSIPGTSWVFQPFTVKFVKNGNEVRAIKSDSAGTPSYLMRGIADSFGVTKWQAWYGPYTVPNGTCPEIWTDVNVQIAANRRAITMVAPIRNGTACGFSGTTGVYNLTR